MMNRIYEGILIILFSAALIFRTHAASAQDMNVAAIGFINKAAETKGIEKYIDGIIKEEVMGTGRYKYVSEEYLLNKWFGEDYYPGVGLSYAVPFILNRNASAAPELYEMQKTLRIDFIIISGAESKGRELAVHSMIACVDNGRYAAVSGVSTYNDLNDTVRRQARYLFGKARQLQKVEADREIDPANSVVAYDFTSEDGNNFEIRVRYNGSRMEPRIEDVFIVPGNAAEESVLSYRLITREGKPVEFKGVCKKGRLTDTVSMANRPENSSGDTFQETLSLLSRGGYILNVTLYWKREELKAAKVEPLMNPYGEIE